MPTSTSPIQPSSSPAPHILYSDLCDPSPFSYHFPDPPVNFRLRALNIESPYFWEDCGTIAFRGDDLVDVNYNSIRSRLTTAVSDFLAEKKWNEDGIRRSGEEVRTLEHNTEDGDNEKDENVLQGREALQEMAKNEVKGAIGGESTERGWLSHPGGTSQRRTWKADVEFRRGYRAKKKEVDDCPGGIRRDGRGEKDGWNFPIYVDPVDRVNDEVEDEQVRAAREATRVAMENEQNEQNEQDEQNEEDEANEETEENEEDEENQENQEPLTDVVNQVRLRGGVREDVGGEGNGAERNNEEIEGGGENEIDEKDNAGAQDEELNDTPGNQDNQPRLGTLIVPFPPEIHDDLSAYSSSPMISETPRQNRCNIRSIHICWPEDDIPSEYAERTNRTSLSEGADRPLKQTFEGVQIGEQGTEDGLMNLTDITPRFLTREHYAEDREQIWDYGGAGIEELLKLLLTRGGRDEFIVRYHP